MSNEDHLQILKQGASAWNTWRAQHRQERIRLNGEDLRGIELRGIDLSEAELIMADLREVNLREVDLSRAVLIGAQLNGACLRDADLSNADLSQAVLIGANLIMARLCATDLRWANLNAANLRWAVLSAADLRKADLSGADLTHANLTEAILIRTNLKEAKLNDCRIYGISVWDLDLTGAEQAGLIITPHGEPTITVDNLEVAQFIYLLLNHKKLRDVINSVTARGVLILGRFGGGGLEVLQSVAAKLREECYLPIIFDFDRPTDRDYTETVKILVGLSRFVIVDLSGPSVPQELSATVPNFKLPFVPILEESRKPYAMSVDIFGYPWVVNPPVYFKSIEELIEKIPEDIIMPAEEKLKERQALLDQLFVR